MKIINYCIILIFFSVISAQKHEKPEKSSRIVSGTDAGKHDWPWMTLIRPTFRNGSKNVVYRCGGTLINDQWILTAAHCVTKTFKKKPLKLLKINVVLGEHNTNKKEREDVHLEAEEVIPHEKFNESTIGNDIALLKLKQNLNFKVAHSHLQPLCLPMPFTEPVHNSCVVTGWGDTMNTSDMSPDLLHEVQLPLINSALCKDLWNKKNNIFLPDVMICAGYVEGLKGKCQGDSGGPLQCKLPNGTWVLQGIVSFGPEGCVKEGKPGVYARVATYINWIKSIMFKFRDNRTFIQGQALQESMECGIKRDNLIFKKIY